MTGLGWVKMRGKKCKTLNCGCCVAENRRDDILWKEAQNDVRYVTSGDAQRDDDYLSLMAELEETYREEMLAFREDVTVDEFTLAKYTWGVGRSDPRIQAILAQKRADFLKRVADQWDALVADAA